MRLFGSERVMGIIGRLGLDEDQEINAKILSNSIENAQKHIEGENFNRRKTVLEYDDVMNLQRNVIYSQRRAVIDGKDIGDTINEMIENVVPSVVFMCSNGDGTVDVDALREKIYWLMLADEFSNDPNAETITNTLKGRVNEIIARQKEAFGENYDELCRMALLRAVDRNWMNHLDAMDDLREGVSFQQKPINEYRMTGSEMFDDMIEQIREDTVRVILFARTAEQIKREQVARAQSAALRNAGAPEKQKPIVKKLSDKVGRNDPCPCGSGKKYKQCCGRNANIEG